MKRILLAILIIPILLCGCGKAAETGTASHAEVTVNYPTDNTVNGYRPSGSEKMPEIISAEAEITPAVPTEDETAPTAYIGNSSSKIFHKTDCSSAAKLKEENRVSFKSREEAVSGGYKACGRCKP